MTGAMLRQPVSEPFQQADAPLRDFTGYALKRAFNAMQADLNATLTRFDLRMITFSALAVIASNPGLRQSQLAETLSIERPNLVLILDELERRGLVTRDRTPNDRRAYALNATLEGQRLYAGALTAVREHEMRVTAGFTDDERTVLMTALHRIEANGNGGKA